MTIARGGSLDSQRRQLGNHVMAVREGIELRLVVRVMGQTSGLRSLQAFEHLCEESRLRLLASLRRHLAVFEFVLGVADATTSLLDMVVDHRHDGVIRDTALARTVVVQHVAGPEPALLHALPRKYESDHCAGGENGHWSSAGRHLAPKNLEFG